MRKKESKPKLCFLDKKTMANKTKTGAEPKSSKTEKKRKQNKSSANDAVAERVATHSLQSRPAFLQGPLVYGRVTPHLIDPGRVRAGEGRRVRQHIHTQATPATTTVNSMHTHTASTPRVPRGSPAWRRRAPPLPDDFSTSL